MILKPAQPHHIQTLHENIRECDRKELMLSLKDPDIFSYLLDLWVRSDICEVIKTDDGIVAGVWGVAPSPESHIGAIWMLATPAIEKVALPFLRACAERIDSAHNIYPVLVCTPWRENALHLRWLEWCDFTSHDPGDGPFIGCTHVRSTRSTNCNGGGVRSGIHCRGSRTEQSAEQGD